MFSYFCWIVILCIIRDLAYEFDVEVSICMRYEKIGPSIETTL